MGWRLPTDPSASRLDIRIDATARELKLQSPTRIWDLKEDIGR
jgi:hypothetical protein